jgi:hypothetical protein
MIIISYFFGNSSSVLLETWEAADRFFQIDLEKEVDDFKIATLLGWTHT